MTTTEIRQKIQANSKRAVLSEAARHEARVRLHSTPTLSRQMSTQAISDYLRWVDELLPNDKYRTFVSLLRFPIPSVELSDQIYTALNKVFDGRNRVYSAEFTSEDAARTAQDWKSTTNFESEFIKKAFKVLKYAFNSVMIVDIPETQNGVRPDPYYYFLPITSVIAWELSEDKAQFEWICFKLEGGNIAYFDNEFYRVYKNDDSHTIGELIKEIAHDIGYCPARYFWDKELNEQYPDIKENPLSKQLGEFDNYVFKAISTRHLDMYASYPIYWGFSVDCDYEYGEDEHRVYCDRGFLRGYDNNYIISGNGIAPCPVCSVNKLNGAGSYIEVDPPSAANDKTDLRDPVGIVEPSINSLEYNRDEVKRLFAHIYRSVTGYGGEVDGKQAINEKQVMAAFEGRADVLKQLKTGFENAQMWLESTIFKIMFGDVFKSVHIDYGTKFYLHSEDTILALYNAAVSSGFDDFILDEIYEQYLETKYKNDEVQKYRAKVMYNLDPYRHMARNEVKDYFKDGLIIDYKEFYLKLNFSTLIARFERENASITAFGENLAFDKKIYKIRESLYNYITVPQEGINGVSN